jgi:outer membrane immunogenic protein
MRRLSRALLAAVSIITLSQVASAADLPVKAWSTPVIGPGYSWTGFYVGGNLGGGWGQQSSTNPPFPLQVRYRDGIIGGGQMGFNWQADQWVFGIEADLQGSGQKANGNFSNPATLTSIGFTNKLEWFGTVRARMGYALDCWLPYVTGGWAYGDSEISGTSTVGITTTSFSGSQSYRGWTIGGGLDWAFAGNWSARAEYLYIDFGGPTVQVAPSGTSIVLGKLTDNIVRAGINYKF